MKPLTIESVSDQVILFMYKYAYDEKYIAVELEMSPQTVSQRIKLNDWRNDEKRALRRLFRKFGVVLIGAAKKKIGIMRVVRN